MGWFGRASLSLALCASAGLWGCGDSAGSRGPLDVDGDAGADTDESPAPPPMAKPGPAPTVLASETDTDGDTISDFHEGTIDTDEDGVPDNEDTDADGDGIKDEDEAGDDDLATAPVDTDKDGAADFRDLDSDDDGLPDATERERETDPLDPDTDGDGVDDLIEVAAETDPKDDTSNPAAEGNFFFRVPYKEDPDPKEGTLVFKPEIQRADVYFMMDSSISMNAVIDELRLNLDGTIVPGVTASIADVQVGAGEFDQCPDNLVGANDVGIHHLAGTTSDIAGVQDAIATVTADGGPSEPYGLAMWLWATGDTTDYPALLPMDCLPGRVGYGCTRPDSLPILVMIGDEAYSQNNSCANNKTPAEIADALNAIGAKLIVMGPTTSVGNLPSRMSWIDVAMLTGSVDLAGDPLFFATESRSELEGGDAGVQVVNAITTLADQIALTLTTGARDVDKGATDFIARIDTNAKGGVADPRDASIVCVGGLDTRDTDGDGRDDTFKGVTPGTPVCFDIIAKKNKTVEPTREPQVFEAEVDVIEVGSNSVVDTRSVFFLVPPKPPTIEEPNVF